MADSIAAAAVLRVLQEDVKCTAGTVRAVILVHFFDF